MRQVVTGQTGHSKTRCNLQATVSVFQMVAGCGGVFLIDRIGRRNSLIFSNLFMLLALGSLSVYCAITQDQAIGGQEPGHLGTTYFEYTLQDGNIGFLQSKNVTGEHREVTHIVFSSGERKVIWDGKGDHQSVSSAYGWVPLVCLVVSQGAVALGVYPVPYILANEYFPTKLRPLAFSIIFNIGIVAAFLVSQLYTPMLEGLTTAGIYGTYATVCAIGIPFAMFFVRETKGKAIG